MKKTLLFLIAMLVTPLLVPALAESIDLAAAQQTAMDFVRSRNASGRFMSAQPQRLWSHAEPSAVKPREAAYYVVNTDRGFVVVSGDDRTRTILAYGDTPLKDLDDLPPGALFWLDLYKQQIGTLQSQPSESVSKQRLRSSWYHPSESISPMLRSQWSQTGPFNKYCPPLNNRYCYAGCSAVALAQVMRYWEYPAGSGSLPAYVTSTLGIELSALDSIAFDWSNILDLYPVLGGYSTEQGNAVATLMRYVGQAMNMDYKQQGSDADEHQILNAIRFFGYDKSACFVEKSSIDGETYYPDNVWSAMLWNELKLGRPVVYCAYAMEPDSTLSGHAFNVDGYDAEEDTYHVNFGYRGTGDGYYALNAFLLSGYQFDIGQLMYLNVMPPRPEPVLWVNKEELDMTCQVGETVVQQIVVAGSDLVSGITATLDDPDQAFTMTVSQQMGSVTVITVTYAPNQFGSHNSSVTIHSEGAQDVTVIIHGSTSFPATNPVLLPADSAYVEPTSFVAEWVDETDAEYVTEYVVEVASTAEFDPADSCYTVITGHSVDSCLVDSLLPGGTYYYRVKALYIDGSESAWSNVESVTLPLPVIDPVMQPADSAYVEPTSFVAEWVDETAAEYVTEYVVEVASTAEFDPADSCYTVITGLSVDSCLVDSLLPGGTYYYRVKALYIDGTESAWSNVESVTLPLPVIDPVMQPADSAYVEPTSFVAEWVDETDDEYVTEYVVEVASTAEFDPADSCYTVISGLTVDSCLVDSLLPGGTYYYRVKALYIDGTESAWSNVESVTLPLPVIDPVMQPADSAYVTPTSFVAEWVDETSSEYVTEYVVEVASTAEFDPADSCYTVITGLSVDSCLVDSLLPGGTYYYRV